MPPSPPRPRALEAAGIAAAVSLISCGGGGSAPIASRAPAVAQEELPGFSFSPPTTIQGPGGANYHVAVELLPPVSVSPIHGQAAPQGSHFLHVRLYLTNLESDRPAPAILGAFFLKVAPGDPQTTYPALGDVAYLPLIPDVPAGPSRPEIAAGATRIIYEYTTAPSRDPVPRAVALAAYNPEGKGLLGWTRVSST